MPTNNRRSLVLYLLLTFAVSSIFYVQAFAGAPVEQVAPGLMWVPGLAAIATQLLVYRTLRGLGWRLGPWRFLAVAALVPIAYCTAIYVPVWLTGLGDLDHVALRRATANVPFTLVFGVLTALGEEIGWRGLLAPVLYRSAGFAWAGLGTGVIWGLWHMPLILYSNYNAGTPAWYALPCFLVSVTGLSVMLAWLRLRSGSLWTAALFHGVHNAMIQGVFDARTINRGATAWITGEFGVGLALVALVIGAYFWRRRAELPAPGSELTAARQPRAVESV